MLIIRGVNIFPSQVEQVLIQMDGVEPHYQLLVERRENMDCLEVLVEMTESLFSDELKFIKRKEQEIEYKLRESLLIHSNVKLVEPKSIARSEGKAKRIVDKRNI
jgi:phenylacetate-CoA ligase